MPSRDDELIHEIVQDTCLYLDRLQHFRLLWADVDGHIMASHIAESTGEITLVTQHLQAVTHLLTEFYHDFPEFDDHHAAAQDAAEIKTPTP